MCPEKNACTADGWDVLDMSARLFGLQCSSVASSLLILCLDHHLPIVQSDIFPNYYTTDVYFSF